MSRRLNDKVAIVTGAGSSGDGVGNGKATAILFAREGAQAVLVDRRCDAVDDTRRRIEEEGGTCLTVIADVAESEGCRRVVETCVDAFGRVDILHNNVGIEIPGGLTSTSNEDWQLTMDTNLRTVFFMCRETIPHMLGQRAGSIISISSINAIRTLPTHSLAYSVSKAGIIALMREIALEYAKEGIRANSILPGMMVTPFVTASLTAAYGGHSDEMMRLRDSLCPTGRQGESWDVAHMALFLASEEAKYVTGAAFVVDGGQSLRLAPYPPLSPPIFRDATAESLPPTQGP